MMDNRGRMADTHNLAELTIRTIPLRLTRHCQIHMNGVDPTSPLPLARFPSPQRRGEGGWGMG